MNKEKFKETAFLFLMNELSGEDKIRFENALLESDELKREFEEIKDFFNLMTSCRPAEAGEAVLTEARYDLMRSIRNKGSKKSLNPFRNIIEGFLLRNYKFVSSIAFTVLLCVIASYFLFSPKENPKLISAAEEYNNAGSINGQKLNEMLAPAEKEEKKQEGDFDAVKVNTKKEKTFNPVTGKFLAASLINNDNPGKRLQALSKISSGQYQSGAKSENVIKQALIAALRGDSNPAVRIEAFNVLSRYAYDDQIRDAFLYVLANDKNSGLRVKAIKALSELKFKGETFDEKTKRVLNKKAETDNNGYVRIHSASMIKEME
jgi:hypothetical protein